MFWKLTLSASPPVEAVLAKENFTLEELLDEEEIIPECKALNSRLINFLSDRAQVEQLLQYIVEEPPTDADSKRTFKFPFIACEIFTCEIDVILKTLVEEEELMNLLFSFLEPNRQHSALLAGYFCKVVVCLMLRKTIPLMNYVKANQDVFKKLVDLIGITSIMEVLVRLVSGDDHLYPNSLDVMQWLADSNLLEMIVDKLNNLNPPEVHANAAETLCAITRNAPSPLADKLSSPVFVERIFGHALEDAHSKSALVHSLSVCISLLDRKRSIPASLSVLHSFRSQHVYETSVRVNPDTVGAMLPKLGELLVLLNVSSDEKVLPATYGELKPPLGKYRLKTVEFLAVLLKTGNEVAEKELVGSGTIRRVLDLFFEYPFNNALHHHVESIICSCLESKNSAIVDHLLVDCNLVGKILQAEKNPALHAGPNQPTIPAYGRCPPRVGYFGHLTRISSKLVYSRNNDIQKHLKENIEWNEWQTTVLQERNVLENVSRWACGRPTALHDRTKDSDEEDVHDRDYDVAALANNLSQAFRYNTYDNKNDAEGNGSLDRDDEDVYFDEESAEAVISSLRLGDDQRSSLFTNSNWFAFQDDRTGGNRSMDTSSSDAMHDLNLNGTSNGGNSSDDEVVVGEEEELRPGKTSTHGLLISNTNPFSELDTNNSVDRAHSNPLIENTNAANGLGFFHFETPENDDPFRDRPTPKWVAWGEVSGFQVGGSRVNPFEDQSYTMDNHIHSTEGRINANSREDSTPNGTSNSADSGNGSGKSNSSQRSVAVPSLFEEDAEFVGVELEGTEKAMEQALKEGIVGEAGPLKRNTVHRKSENEDLDDGSTGMKEFNDANYWRVDQEVAVLE